MSFVKSLFGIDEDEDYGIEIKKHQKYPIKEENEIVIKYFIKKVKNINELSELIKLMKNEDIIITINAEELPDDEKQRTIDILSGAIRVMNGNLVFINNSIFTMYPKKVALHGIKERVDGIYE